MADEKAVPPVPFVSAVGVIPAPGTRFVPLASPATSTAATPATASAASVAAVPAGNFVSTQVAPGTPKPAVDPLAAAVTPPSGSGPGPAPAPAPGPGPIINPIDPDEPIGTTIRKLGDDIRLLAVHQPAEKETSGRALARLAMLANAINAQPTPEAFKPILPRFFVIERELTQMMETIEPTIVDGRALARDTGKPVVVAQAVLVLNHLREIKEDWL
jgi:hypothetical protein